MAFAEKRGEWYRIVFRYRGRRYGPRLIHTVRGRGYMLGEPSGLAEEKP